jgi:ATPase subunit of ABC transporter with duplicated ATPase domains
VKGRTQRYYDANPEAKARKAKYDAKFQKKREQVKKRVEANRFNRNNPSSVKGDGMDASHRGGRIVLEKARTNRARGGAKKR